MVKAYLRYELSGTWGVLTSVSNVCYDHSGKYLVTAALENVLVWNVKQAVVVRSKFTITSSSVLLLADSSKPPLHPLNLRCLSALPQVKSLIPPLSQSGAISGEVTRLAASPATDQIAVGHADGTVSCSRPCLSCPNISQLITSR
jgi:U3 small nucleolar RNA-associated protein 12